MGALLLKLTKLSKFLALLALLNWGSAVHANCFGSVASERLQAYCALVYLQRGALESGQAGALDFRLKRMGYKQGLGNDAVGFRSGFNTSISPMLSYDSNINGGNPDKPLVLDNIYFVGDPVHFRKSGVLIGANFGVTGRQILGEGKYVVGSAQVSYEQDATGQAAVHRLGGSFCSLNHIRRWWHVDFCAGRGETRKELSHNYEHHFSIMGAKLFSLNETTFYEIEMGAQRYSTDSYSQDQLVLKLARFHIDLGVLNLNFRLGKAVPNHLSNRLNIAFKFSPTFVKGPLSLTVGYSDARGGRLLGYKRDEKTYNAFVSYPITRRISARLGIEKTNSSIDYFDKQTPFFGVSFSSLNF